MMPTITIQDVIKGNYTEQDLKMDLGRQLATVSGLIRVDDKNMPTSKEKVQVKTKTLPRRGQIIKTK